MPILHGFRSIQWTKAHSQKISRSDIQLQVNYLSAAVGADVIAQARLLRRRRQATSSPAAAVMHRDREMLWSDAEVVDATTGDVTTRGTVFYRLTS